MNKIFLIILLLSFLPRISIAQNSKVNFSDLYFYSDVMVNASSENHRLRALEKFQELFYNELSSENAFSKPLEKIPFISTVIPQDSTFKLFTFNMVEESGVTRDFGYILSKNGDLFKLKPETNLEDIEYEALNPDRWVSGLYYHMIPFTNDKKKYYLLFGFSQPNFYEKRKVIEILHFEDGKPIFGKDLLVKKYKDSRDDRRYREIYHYSSDAVMTIRDDDALDALVVDHLMEVKTRIPGYSGNSFVPDGTYTAFFLENGEWIYKNKLWEEKDVNKFEKEEDEDKPKSSLFGNKN